MTNMPNRDDIGEHEVGCRCYDAVAASASGADGRRRNAMKDGF